MSLGVVFKGPEGVVLAADSRVTLTATLASGGSVAVGFDNATKLLKVKGQDFVAAVTYGQGALGQAEPRTAHSFLPEFEAELADSGRLTVHEFASRLGAFFKQQWDTAEMPDKADPLMFLVGGYDAGAIYGSTYEVGVPVALDPKERPPFGIAWGGQIQTASRLLNGYDRELETLLKDTLGLDDAAHAELMGKLGSQLATPIPYQFLPLQDCVDLSILLVRTTARLQDFYVGIRGVGGAIDVATITRTEGYRAIQEKQIGGER